MTPLNAITTIVRNDLIYSKDKQIGGEQIACQVLLCHFHAIKAWRKYLLSCTPFDRRNKLWQLLMTLLHCPVEAHFYFNVQNLF